LRASSTWMADRRAGTLLSVNPSNAIRGNHV
jgi:hypothetical protein